MSIFTSKKVKKFLMKIQLAKSDPKRTRGWKVSSLMPIRVNYQYINPAYIVGKKKSQKLLT